MTAPLPPEESVADFKEALRELVDSAARGAQCTKKELARRAGMAEGTLSKATGDRYPLARWGSLSRSIISTCLENAGRPGHEQELWKKRWNRAHATQGHTPEPVPENDPQDHTPEPVPEDGLYESTKAAHAAQEAPPPEMTGPDKPPVRQRRKRALVAGGVVLALISGVSGAVIATLLNSHPAPPVSSPAPPVSSPTPPVSSPTPPGQELCDGPDSLRICVEKDHSGSLRYWATTNVSEDCTITIGLYDDVSDYRGPVLDRTKGPCKPSQKYGPRPLGDPTAGRPYHSELVVEWGYGKTEVFKSPTLVW